MQPSLTWLAEEIERFYNEVSELRVASQVDPATIRACITSFRTQPGDIEILLDELREALGS